MLLPNCAVLPLLFTLTVRPLRGVIGETWVGIAGAAGGYIIRPYRRGAFGDTLAGIAGAVRAAIKAARTA